jgi:ubiquinol-cytochrome c reductase cytochrome c subunit
VTGAPPTVGEGPRPRRTRRLVAGPAALLVAGAVVFSVLALTSSTAHAQQSLVSTNPQDIANGQVLYDEHCESCHGYEGRGGVVEGAPALVSVGAAAADFYLVTGRMPLNAPDNQPLQNTPLFSKQEIRDLVAYVNALPVITGTYKFGPTIPTVLPLCKDETSVSAATNTNPDCVTLSEGQQLYQVNCAQCHQAAGSGGMLSKGDVIPTLRNASLEIAAEAPIVGPKPMPIFGPKELSHQQLSAIAQYVHYLNNPDSPGGFGISYFGPVAEGFFGVLVGFVVLWLALRLTGARR